MRSPMIIFLAFVSVAVLVNAMMILLTYRAFATMTTKVSDSLRQMGRSAQTRDWLTAMQTASVRAVDLTQSTRQQLELSGPRLEELHSTLGYGLAKIDVRFERFCDLVHKEARTAQMAITGPTQRVGAAATGFLEVLSVMGYGGSADDASSRRKQ